MASQQQFEHFDVRDFSTTRCPLHGLLNILSGPWTMYILWLLRTHGEMRFGQIKKQLPNISAKVLTERLRMLEEADILIRRHEPTIPPKVSYRFSERGHQLENILDQINTLATAWSQSAPLKG
ncbi:MAG: helix-turn-helix domain-containing protein [Pseudomonadota bacterium]